MEQDLKNDLVSQVLEINRQGLRRIIISGPHKSGNAYKKITGQPVSVKKNKAIQFSYYTDKMVFHYNCENDDEISAKLCEILGLGYKQWDIEGVSESLKYIINKKGNFKKITINCPKQAHDTNTIITQSDNTLPTHNREKNHILKEGEPLDMLISLGVMNKDGKVLAPMQKKFRQINKFLETISQVAEFIDDGAHIIDFGCGKSYLTFALYYYLNIMLGKNITITGLDLKKDVVENCSNLSEKCGFSGLKFYCGDIGDAMNGGLGFEESNNEKCSMMVTLHACDTATDYALAYAIKYNVKVILSVPCCQHELFTQVENDSLKPLIKHGILKERFASLLTDAARGQLLEAFGYKVSIMEFIDMEHTPKNIMIKALRLRSGINTKLLEEYRYMAESYNIKPCLYGLLEDLLNE